MKTKFTKGDWIVEQGNNWPFELSVSTETAIVANICSEVISTSHKSAVEFLKHNNEAAANARLLAASPRLLKALVTCHKALATYGNHPIIDAQVDNLLKDVLL